MDKKISALPAATVLDGTETLPVVQGGATKKVTPDVIASRAFANPITVPLNLTGVGSQFNLSAPDNSTPGIKFVAPEPTQANPGPDIPAIEMWGKGSVALPYRRGSMWHSGGAFYTAAWIVISNKRANLAGDWVGCGGLPDGSEPAMLDVSPDVPGPAVRIEGRSDLSTIKNGVALSIGDLSDLHGPTSAWSGGYGKAKLKISGDGTCYWGANLLADPVANADVTFGRTAAHTASWSAGTAKVTLRQDSQNTVRVDGVNATLVLNSTSGVYPGIYMRANDGDVGGISCNSNSEIQFLGAGAVTFSPSSGNGLAETKKLKVDLAHGVTVNDAALATNATAGFLWIPSCPGTPTGAPSLPYADAVALVIDSTTGKLYGYIGSTWVQL